MWRTARRILAFVPAQRRVRLYWWTAAASALVLADLAAIMLVAISVSSLAAGADQQVDAPWSPGFGLALAAVVLVVRGIAALVTQKGQARALADIEIDLAGRLTDGYLTASWLWVSQGDSNRAMRLAETGVSRVVGWFLKPLFTSVADIIGVVAIAGLVLVWNPAVGIAAFTYGALVAFLLFRVLAPRVMRAGQTSFSAEHEMQKKVSQAWAAAAEIRVFGLTKSFADDVKQARAQRAQANAVATVMTSAPQYVVEMALVAGLGLLALGMVVVGRGDAVLSVVAVLAVVALRLLPGMLRLQGGMTSAKHNLVWAEQLLADLDELAAISDVPAAAGAPDDGSFLRLQGVGVQYPARDQPTLREVDLRLSAGDRLGIIGASGVGKSTLAAVILGLLVPTAGQVQRAPIRAALLSQDAAVLEGSIRANLVFARPWLTDVDDDRLRAALEAAGLLAEVDAMPDGLQTQVGESGRSLSGGQRQRLGLARALLDDPGLLVLDEPTSQLDDQNAAWVRAAIERLPAEVAVVFVTHRPQLLEGFARVVRIDQGRVVEVTGSAQQQAETPADGPTDVSYDRRHGR